MAREHVTYVRDPEGVWWKVSRGYQCRHAIKNFLAPRGRDYTCQGVKGHGGPHWCYGPTGWLHLKKNKGAFVPGWNGVASMDCPPGSRSWVSPLNMLKDACESCVTRTRVTDPVLIERMNGGKFPAGASGYIVSEVDLEDAGRPNGS